MRSSISAAMNKFRLYFILFFSLCVLFSCNQSDSASTIPIRDFDLQYADDIAIIEDYLNTHYIEVSTTDQFLTFPKITGSQPSIMSYLIDYNEVSDVYPQLKKKPVVINDKTYFIYFLKYRANNSGGVKPSKADEVFAAFDGRYLQYKTEEVDGVDVTSLVATQFQYIPFPSGFLRLDTSIRGWREVMPFFKSGTAVNVPGEPERFDEFGYGAMFVPSGLAYFSQPQIGIPSYSPLVFSFKLLDVKYGDQDLDGVLSNDEDLNQDGEFNNDDTDGDGTQNLYDTDDDGDSYLTRNEIKINGVIPSSYSQILDCSGTTTGVKKHLDRNCH